MVGLTTMEQAEPSFIVRETHMMIRKSLATTTERLGNAIGIIWKARGRFGKSTGILM